MFPKLGKHLLEAPAGGAVTATVSRISKVGLCDDPQSRLQHVHLDLIILDAVVETTSSTCQYTWAPYQVLFRCPPPHTHTHTPPPQLLQSISHVASGLSNYGGCGRQRVTNVRLWRWSIENLLSWDSAERWRRGINISPINETEIKSSVTLMMSTRKKQNSLFILGRNANLSSYNKNISSLI